MEIGAITDDGTELGTNYDGTIIFDDGKMKTQTDAGAYVAGITTPFVGSTDDGGRIE